LPTRYRAALSAAEHALGQGSALVFSTPETRRTSRHHLRDLRRELARSVSEDPNVLGPRFERYLESVAVHSSYGMEAMRAQLAAGLDEITAALGDTGALEERDLGELEQALERSSDAASTAHELSAAYRKCVLDMVLALKRPLEARQERSLGRALAYIDEHFAEALTLQKVARVAGFAPGYFSKLFAKTERTSFREYTLKLRVERAKHMLKATTLSAERVGQLCGFRTRNRFYVAFRRLARVAPLAYRAQELRQAKPRRANQLVARGRKNDSPTRRVER
jgi:AraC-like DNA-binding protein